MNDPTRRSFALGSAALFSAMLGACKDEQPWRLVDVNDTLPRLSLTMIRASDGKVVGANDYRGKVVVLFFGFTFCPDICPTTLANLTAALERLGPVAEEVSVLFVTVDPNRDTTEVLKEYVGSFSPRIDGLRGTADQLADLARRYRAAYSVEPTADGRSFEVMHGSTLYVFDRSGEIRLLSPNADKVDDFVADLRRLADEKSA